MKNTRTFKSKNSDKVYQIKKNFNGNSKMVVYLIECRICKSNTMYARANNYKSTHCNFLDKQKLSNQVRNQKRFHENYLQSDHNRFCDWEIMNTLKRKIFKTERIILVS